MIQTKQKRQSVTVAQRDSAREQRHSKGQDSSPSIHPPPPSSHAFLICLIIPSWRLPPSAPLMLPASSALLLSVHLLSSFPHR